MLGTLHQRTLRSSQHIPWRDDPWNPPSVHGRGFFSTALSELVGRRLVGHGISPGDSPSAGLSVSGSAPVASVAAITVAAAPFVPVTMARLWPAWSMAVELREPLPFTET